MTDIRRLLPLVLLFCSVIAIGQTKKNNIYISSKSLVGVWQFGDPRVGNGLNQNFEFYSNGKFVFHIGKFGDDLVSTTQIKGKYRLINDSLFFTVTSRVIIADGRIGTVDQGISGGIFEFNNGREKEIRELSPKEDADPAFIRVVKMGHIQINDEHYYKINPALLKAQHFSPDVY